MLIIKKALARWDRFVTRSFHLYYFPVRPGEDGADYEVTYYLNRGKKRFGIVRDGQLIRTGGWREIVHRYDDQNKLLSRQLARKMRKPSDSFLTGHLLEVVLKRKRKSKRNHRGFLVS